MACAVEQRRTAEAAAERLAAEPTIEATSIVPAAEDPTGRWTVEITTERGVTELNSDVHGVISDFELDLKYCRPRQEWWHAVAVV